MRKTGVWGGVTHFPSMIPGTTLYGTSIQEDIVLQKTVAVRDPKYQFLHY